MSSTHLIVGTGGPTGRHLRDLLESSGDRVFNTHYRPRTLPKDVGSTVWLPFDLLDPDRHLPSLVRVLSGSSFSSLVFFAHPAIARNTGEIPRDQTLVLVKGLLGVRSLLDSCIPWLKPGGKVLFIVPDLSALKVSGYLAARIYFGGLKGLVEEYARTATPPKATIALTSVLHIPGETDPHVSSETLDRMERQTLSGRLPDGKELSNWIYDLIRSPHEWIHGKILPFQDGPLF